MKIKIKVMDRLSYLHSTNSLLAHTERKESMPLLISRIFIQLSHIFVLFRYYHRPLIQISPFFALQIKEFLFHR